MKQLLRTYARYKGRLRPIARLEERPQSVGDVVYCDHGQRGRTVPCRPMLVLVLLLFFVFVYFYSPADRQLIAKKNSSSYAD